MSDDDTTAPDRSAPPRRRWLRWVVVGVVGLVGLFQIAVGAQVGRPGPVVGGAVLLGLAALLGVRANRATVGRRGG